MSRWHGLVLPSHREALPLCIIEAQLMRIPVIGTACGGIPELITDRVTGFLARSPAAPDLADALIRMRADPHLPLITQQALRQAEMRHHPRGYLHALRNVLELPGP
jgi:glycosyltransferase involved in cell wall biosynthesis